MSPEASRFTACKDQGLVRRELQRGGECGGSIERGLYVSPRLGEASVSARAPGKGGVQAEPVATSSASLCL